MLVTIDPTGSEGPQELFLTAQHLAARSRHLCEARLAERLPTDAERGAVAQCLIHCADAALEWIHWAFLTTRIPLSFANAGPVWLALVEPWSRTPTVAQAMGRSDRFRLNSNQGALLVDLAAWHGLLNYGNEQCENQLHRRIRTLGLIDGRQSVRQALTADIAGRAIAKTAVLFDWAGKRTSLPTPTIDPPIDPPSQLSRDLPSHTPRLRPDAQAIPA